MPYKVERQSSVNSPIVATASAASTPRIPYGAVGGGTAIVTASAGAGTLSWHVAASPESTLYPAYNAAGAVTTLVQAGRAYKVPDDLFGAPFIAAVTDAGTATIVLCVKG